MELNKECEYGACFVAGTLVHTDKGLVPIEQLKVGDMVLSKHESGEGEQAYKPIIDVFRSEDAQVLQLAYYDVSNPMSDLKAKLLYLTAGHLIWVAEDENGKAVNDWVSAGDIVGGSVVEFSNGRKAYVDGCQVITGIDDCTGYVLDLMEEFPEIVVDFSGNKIQSYYVGENYSGAESSLSEETIAFDENYDVVVRFLDFIERGVSPRFFTATVYNIEVADFHTYYVGSDGVWVKNEGNCPSHEFNLFWNGRSQ